MEEYSWMMGAKARGAADSAMERRGSGSAFADPVVRKKPRTSIWTGPYVVYRLPDEDIESDLRTMLYGHPYPFAMGAPHAQALVPLPASENSSLKRKAR